MYEEKIIENTTTNISENKRTIAWMKEHGGKLLFAGASIVAISIILLGLKNKGAIVNFWNSTKNGTLFSAKWFENASLEEFKSARKLVEIDYNNPNLSSDYRVECGRLLHNIDNAIARIKWASKEYGYPVHTSNGWHLPSDD